MERKTPKWLTFIMDPRSLIIVGLTALCIYLGYYALQWCEFSSYDNRYHNRATDYGKTADSHNKTIPRLINTTFRIPESEEALLRFVKYYDSTCKDSVCTDTICDGCICSDGDSCTGRRLRSVWVDDTTILHIAYFIFRHRSVDSPADGVRIYIEKYPDSVANPRGGWYPPNTYNMALVTTRSDKNGNHLDWFRSSNGFPDIFSFLSASSDVPDIDNYNNPCPPDTTNCKNTIGGN